jgi:5-methylcytosine-specific restriction endonuclease McrA
VWSRDQGQCVRCRAAEYLEFDHIIPHSKGGSNSINNVQLLCRKCNLYKSDRI